ncbi:thioesterase [Streptomyces actinomycinicus]|uniref:Thioesterase n=1 Tax=Streptomyces actinomycinicus TaxID=1695166 RepID=A0A937EHF5_9ACTN|nr:alpha/beta fold hydrolase [Streptomyces actinomycinicus]MBL1082335.1 thioesterase [Streptomyces actinomycinicus]
MQNNSGRSSVSLHRFGPPGDAAAAARRATLVCFPHAGGGATAYASWRRALPERIELHAHVPPGREARGREAPLDSVADLAADVLPALLALPAPLVLAGHSFGACLAYELTHQLTQRGRPPAHLFVLAAGAPGPATPQAPRDDHEIELLWKRLGANTAGLDRPGFRERFFPVLRADLAAHAAFRPPPGRPPLTVPVTAMYGDEDPEVTADVAVTWAALCRGPFGLAAIPGGHFFPQNSATAATGALVRALEV